MPEARQGLKIYGAEIFLLFVLMNLFPKYEGYKIQYWQPHVLS